ncbi:MAG: glycoside hydrolase family 127 protein, partial [Akkermansiaceae bacterium]|nr:glycoside hydrolase family 127 protein [Akkermansiaceae bacterium]
MKPPSVLFVPLASSLAACFLPPFATAESDYPVKPVPFTDVRFTAGLWQQRQETNHRVTLPFALDQLESSKRLLNFDLAAETMRRRAAGEKDFQHQPPTQYPFDDSDVTKALEGAAFSYSVKPDPGLAKRMETIIARIAAAQEPDGYLFTFRTMHPDTPAHPWIDEKRWLKDPGLSHELYNLGHMFEAGVAHAQATGSHSLLDVCLKSAELLQRDFGDGKLVIAPGHQVVEMGLAKLFRQTGDERWLNLARIFLEARGRSGTGTEYSQDHLPVTAQREAVGHAVRANYLYSGMADVAALKGDDDYLTAIHAIWENVVGKKLHLTGGCGARGAGEAYGDNYELPHRCYNETCAAIAFLFWNHRMFLMTGEARFMDVFERTLYNGFLSGVSLSGDRFFYPNPLEYDGKEANNHGHAGRAPWFGCACCPPNVLRTMASLGGYAYAVRDNDLYINLYAEGQAKAEVATRRVRVSQQTGYPWNGAVKLTVIPDGPQDFALCLRIPGWVLGKPLPSDLYHYLNAEAAAWSVKVNGAPVQPDLKDGYARIRRTWQPGDVV